MALSAPTDGHGPLDHDLHDLAGVERRVDQQVHLVERRGQAGRLGLTLVEPGIPQARGRLGRDGLDERELVSWEAPRLRPGDVERADGPLADNERDQHVGAHPGLFGVPSAGVGDL